MGVDITANGKCTAGRDSWVNNFEIYVSVQCARKMHTSQLRRYLGASAHFPQTMID